MFYQVQRPSRMVCGVCAELAERSGLPVWMVRVGALILLVSHAALAGVIYIGLALWLRGGNGACAGRSWRGADFGATTARPEPPPPPPAWDRDGLTTRFSRLDRRLADMERAALDREMGLRQAFRDLDRGR
jgi:phage shock protein PspC (stress-responsive transcriptional regulator)